MGSNRSDGVFIERMLDDPLVQLLMAADKVDRDSMVAMLQRASGRLSSREMVEAEPVRGHWPEDPRYRSGVGIMLLNSAGRVFIGRRIDQAAPCWQMPQGGVDAGETPRRAALRELKEKTGVSRVEVLAETEGWLRYAYPPEVAAPPGFEGQQQKWFAMLFVGEDDEIDIATGHPAFGAWRWARPERLPELIIAFKRQLYRDATAAFSEPAPSGPAGKPVPGAG